MCHVSRGRGPGEDVSRLWSLGHGAHFCKIFARDEQVIFIFNSLIFCTWHQWTDNLRTAIIMKGSKSWSASHCINYVCNSFQQFRVWKYCVEISSTRTCAGARVRTLEYKRCPQQSDIYLIRHCDRHLTPRVQGTFYDRYFIFCDKSSQFMEAVEAQHLCIFSVPYDYVW